jgi:hypothetical protein
MAFWNYKEQKWVFNARAFLLIYNKESRRLMGQYVTSMWFNSETNQEASMHCIIFGVKDVNSDKIDKIIEELNRNENTIPSINDLPYSTYFCEYFMGSKNITQEIVEKLKNTRATENFTFTGQKNHINSLSFHYNYTNGMFLTTLPEFLIEF